MTSFDINFIQISLQVVIITKTLFALHLQVILFMNTLFALHLLCLCAHTHTKANSRERLAHMAGYGWSEKVNYTVP